MRAFLVPVVLIVTSVIGAWGSPAWSSAAAARDDAVAPAEATPPPAAAARAASLPTTAAGALDRAAAAYEFGDIQQMVDLARLVADGALPAGDDERAQGHRLLGIGLFLTGRADRAEGSFVQLLSLQPHARLDRSTTRPDVVAFFDDVRRKHGPKKRLAFNLIPPLGQFQNGTPVRGWLIFGAEVVSLGLFVGTFIRIKTWEIPDSGHQSKYPETARKLKTVNYITAVTLAASYVLGVIDGFVGYGRDDTAYRSDRRLSFALFPGGGAMRVSF